MFCNQCGKQILDTSVFCSFCGVKISSNENHSINSAGYFWELAKLYLPDVIKFLLIAESPPKNPRNYFYYIGSDEGNYCFFQNIIFGITGEKYKRNIEEKKKLLKIFYDKGCFLTDAVEKPLEIDAKSEILNAKPSLFNRLKKFNFEGRVNAETKIVLIKNLVCKLLKASLEEEKEIVFNRTSGIECLPFPGFFMDPKCYGKLRNIINSRV